MMRCETIVWHPYIPSTENYDNVPNKEGSYDVIKGGQRVCLDWDNGYVRWLPLNAQDYETVIDDSDITYYAERKPFDPTAKTFNFQTALELMRQGLVCRSLANRKQIKIIDDSFYSFDHYQDFNGTDDGVASIYVWVDDWIETDLSLSEILGEWEKA